MSSSCCPDPRTVRREESLESGGFSFPVTLVYCESCGKLKIINCGIKDGRLLTPPTD